MKTLRFVGVLAAACVSGTVGLSASGQVQLQAQPQAQPVPAPAPQLPPFDRLAKLGPDGKIVRLDGILDVMAIPRNTLVDAETRERLRPAIATWYADVDQLVIDNLDFLEAIEPPDGSPGVIDKMSLNDITTVTHVARMLSQLMSAGPLSHYLEQKEVLNRTQSQRNQEIVTDYLQQVMNEIMAEAGVPNDQSRAPLDQEQQVKQADAVTRFLNYMSCRDAHDSYHRQLAEAAQHMETVAGAMALTDEQRSKIREPLAGCREAKTYAEKQKASRKVLDQLTFDQRREVLQRVRDIAGPYDPLADLPPQGSFPPPTQQARPAVAPAPAANQAVDSLPGGR